MATAETAQREPLRAAGDLRLSATVGVGTVWLTAHLAEFLDLYPTSVILICRRQ